MGKKLVVTLLTLGIVVAVGASGSMIWAAPSQSLHFNSATPGAAAAGNNDLSVGVKAKGMGPENSGAIDLVSGEAATRVHRRAARGLCIAGYSDPGATCSYSSPDNTCTSGVACCDNFIDFALNPTITLTCLASDGRGWRIAGSDSTQTSFLVVARPDATLGDVSHLGADNKNVYNDLGSDIAGRGLIQVRPNGLTGTIQIRIFHTQAGANPRIASVTVDTTNNDPNEAAVLHASIATALANISPALSPAIIAINHTVADATYPLTAFGNLKQASNFVEITNIAAVGITKVDVATPASSTFPGMGITAEGSENTIDTSVAAGVPTLNTWGIVALAALLLLAGYWLMRRQRQGTATA